MNSIITEQERSAAASALAHKAELAQRLGSHHKSVELLDAAMRLDPTPDRIRAWLGASASGSSGVEREALLEIASWF